MDLPSSWVIEQKALTAMSFITFFLVILPLPGYIRVRNIGCSLYASWIAFLCFSSFINGILWRDHARNIAPIWCEIYIRLQWAGSMGILSAGLVIARRVSNIANSTFILHSDDQRRAMFTDLAIGLVPPISQLIEFWFVQGHRFDIFEGLGCFAIVPFSILSICLTWGWNLIIGILSATYCVRTIIALLRRHKDIKKVLTMTKMDLQLFHRLVAMAIVEMMGTVPLVTYVIVSAAPGYYPWNGFADLHLDFNRIDQFPYGLWSVIYKGYRPDTIVWFQIGCGLLFFGLLGLTRDACSRYKRMFGLSKLFTDSNEKSDGAPSSREPRSLVFWHPRSNPEESNATFATISSRWSLAEISSTKIKQQSQRHDEESVV
ncbi:hypothetical protein QCA50_017366 [Cerrena zonata]|uniref:Pheromone receptor n=1 Tax=Cerrena zonata TaxID=2478898 RepID=A0AAW0FL31_9APHY